MITSLIAAPLVLAGIFLLPPLGFSLFIGAIIVLAAWEWGNLAGLAQVPRCIFAALVALVLFAISLASVFYPSMPHLLLAAHLLMAAALVWWLAALYLVATFPTSSHYWSSPPITLLAGLLTLTAGWTSLVLIRQSDNYTYLICLLFFLIWGADIGAYFVGKAFGKAKLAPNVSPGKSWAGLCGGLATALVIAAAMSLWLGRPSLGSMDGLLFLSFCAMVTLASVLGDLTISMFKRQRNIKDASNLLPGHGGLLDRIDSLLAATPLFAAGL
ncbi:MAG: phosphatidate cytidylyltransferase [Pseudomonadales bacterium]